jgi:hypothetical protein
MPEPGQFGRLAWFVALWGASVAVVGAISLVLRAWLLG